MKTAEKIALAYGLSVAGAAAFSYWRGKATSEILTDALMHGAVAGTALTVVGWLVTESGASVPILASTNSEDAGVGKLTQQGVELLSRINGSDIFRYLKENGVKIDVVPENPSMINQDND